jgi:ribose 5-phosphate isomerase B
MKITIGGDHAGFELATELANWASSRGFSVRQVGATSVEPYDYPDAADLVARDVRESPDTVGVLCCGTGIGVSIRANRYEGVRAANCVSQETARLARQHNHANVLCLGSRILNNEQAKQILETFLHTKGSEEERHVRRVEGLDRPANAEQAPRAGD